MMKEKEEKMHLPKVTVDNFFMTQEERDEERLEKIQKLSVYTISDFPNHPYQVKDNEEMNEFVENIKENGIINPVIVRQKEDGSYEMISGHRRKRACELAGIKEIPAIVRKVTDEEASSDTTLTNEFKTASTSFFVNFVSVAIAVTNSALFISNSLPSLFQKISISYV